MSNPFLEARYLPLPAISPYVSPDRYERPKAVFEQVVRRLRDATEPGRALACADIACANGELLYLMRKEFPTWALSGFDKEPSFIECGRAFPGLAGVELQVKDFLELDASFDVVTCIGTLHMLWDLEQPLVKLLSLCREGGLLVVDGCFNPYEVEVRTVFMDNSRPESEGIWRRDFSQHSRSHVAGILEGRCRSFEFEDVVMNVDIPRRRDAPHANVWTFRDQDGRRVVTNGARMILDKTLLTVRL